MTLSSQNTITLRTFARAQADWHRGLADEVGKLLRTQSVTQPNSRSTVELHDFAWREQQEARRWLRCVR